MDSCCNYSYNIYFGQINLSLTGLTNIIYLIALLISPTLIRCNFKTIMALDGTEHSQQDSQYMLDNTIEGFSLM